MLKTIISKLLQSANPNYVEEKQYPLVREEVIKPVMLKLFQAHEMAAITGTPQVLLANEKGSCDIYPSNNVPEGRKILLIIGDTGSNQLWDEEIEGLLAGVNHFKKEEIVSIAYAFGHHVATKSLKKAINCLIDNTETF